MNKLVEIIEESELSDKKTRINKIRTDQLIGIEKSTTMFTLAISNMLFRGDGKSKLSFAEFL